MNGVQTSETPEEVEKNNETGERKEIQMCTIELNQSIIDIK